MTSQTVRGPLLAAAKVTGSSMVPVPKGWGLGSRTFHLFERGLCTSGCETAAAVVGDFGAGGIVVGEAEESDFDITFDGACLDEGGGDGSD